MFWILGLERALKRCGPFEFVKGDGVQASGFWLTRFMSAGQGLGFGELRLEIQGFSF